MLGLRRFVNSGNLPQIALARAERPRSRPRSRRPQTCGGLFTSSGRADRADRRAPASQPEKPPAAPNGGSLRACHPTADHVPRSARAGRRPIKPQQLTARTVPGLPLRALSAMARRTSTRQCAHSQARSRWILMQGGQLLRLESKGWHYRTRGLMAAHRSPSRRYNRAGSGRRLAFDATR